MYARDREDPDGPLRYLPPGGAERFRAMDRAGRLLCPFRSCAQQMSVVGGETRRHHFRHPPGYAHPGGVEGEWHLAAKEALRRWLDRRLGPCDEVRVDDRVLSGGEDGGKLRPDVLVRFAGGARVGFEVQYSSLSIGDWRARHARYQQQRIHDVWLFAHHGPQYRPAGRRHGHRGRGGEKEEIWVKLSELHQAVRKAGCDLLWFNPTAGPEGGMVGTPYVLDPLVLPAPAEVEPGQARRYPAAPGRLDRSARLRADPLQACRLDRASGRFATPTHQWLADQAERAARIRQQARERSQARQQVEAARAREAWERWQRSLVAHQAQPTRDLAEGVLLLAGVLLVLALAIAWGLGWLG